MLFEFVIVEKPSKTAEEKGELERIVIGPKLIVAKDADNAKTLALLDKEFQMLAADCMKSRIEVFIRPFK